MTASSTCWATSAALLLRRPRRREQAPCACAPVNRTPTGRMTSDATVSSGESHSMIAERDDQQHQRARDQRHHPQQALHQLQVGDGARDDLPGAQRVLLRPVEALRPSRTRGGAGRAGPRARGGPRGSGAGRRRRSGRRRWRPSRSPAGRAPRWTRRRRGRPPCAISSGPTASRLTPSTEAVRAATVSAGRRQQSLARRRIQPRARPVGTSSRAGTRSVVRSVVPSGEVVVDGRSPPRLGRHPDSSPDRGPRGDERPASWSNTPVRHFLLGPLWESRRAHVFDERCRRA